MTGTRCGVRCVDLGREDTSLSALTASRPAASLRTSTGRRTRCTCYLYVQADDTLGQFMDYCTYGHMIDNVVLIVTGTLHERDVQVRRRAASCGPADSQRRPPAAQRQAHSGRSIPGT